MKKFVKVIKSVSHFALVITSVLLMFSCSNKRDVAKDTSSEEVVETTIAQTTAAQQSKNIKKIDKIKIDNDTNYLCVEFGTYGEKIEWLVIDKNDDTVLMLSKKILDCKNYNNENIEVDWKDSDLRNWLNSDFIIDAFTSEEQKLFGNMSEYGFEFIKGDNASLLNIKMCEEYFDVNIGNKQNKKLAAKATDFAKERGLECDDNENTDFYDCGSYYLTDNGDSLDKAAWVGQYGKVYIDGQAVKLEKGDGVRPIICVKTEIFTNGVIDSINANIFHIETNVDGADIEKRDRYTYSNVANTFFQSNNILCSEKNVVDLASWKYGRTPAEWVYVMPNTQLLSNSSPNKSSKFGYKVKASSGPKGCYMVAFTNCDEVKGLDYDGRLYCFEDYTKIPLDEIKFSNRFDELKYGEYNVLELLKKKYEMIDISRGVYMARDVYVNIVYVDELDEIIAEYCDNE